MWTYASLVKWFDFPSTLCLFTIVRDVKGHLVTTKCNGRSYVIFLLILPLHHLKNKLSFKQTYTEIQFLCILTVRHISRSLVTTKWQ